MRYYTTTWLALFACAGASQHGHGHSHRHRHRYASVDEPLEKRSGSCKFPKDAGLIEITPSMTNGGWALSPDQSCEPGGYCPYACPPGQLSMQWDPDATSYSYPASMNGGLYCDDDGKIKKPFPDKPYCQDGTGAVAARSKCKKGGVSFCQTVLPGNEAMLIPTMVEDVTDLAVPDPEYWCETSAHFYINPPGYDPETACVWGTSSNPYGNWSPYVAGANTDKKGQTFVKLAWNPVYLEPATPFRDVVPDFGVEIECDGGECQGLPCKIDPDVNAVNEVCGKSEKEGAGGGAFCVVTVPKGAKAHIVVFDKAGSDDEDDEDEDDEGSSTTLSIPSSTEEPTSTKEPTSTEAPTSTDAPTSSTSSASTTRPTSGPSSSGGSSSSYTYRPPVLIETGTAQSAGTRTATPSSSAQSGSTREVVSMGFVVAMVMGVLGVREAL
ncbi:hypothetical protein P168DRAFT_27406 [Aspergillus campestris IBT 28561]|uniref:SUN domain protein n=1 Tax=Aspergillus campestris (strain IBT 28561) TaxID=1392248 RepID=A0A2I1DGG2_ASPC2|nr:uncharacterized protein P168DRAFT_27406 [Aspergillus campestris IBT 28561]PKY08959.1 hypothetical protein P168DRAFT_27406 [Aspergillus campestris IBT 28561]